MPYRRFEWHEHIKEIEGEYKAVRIAVDRLKAQLVATPDIIRPGDASRESTSAQPTVTLRERTWSEYLPRSRPRPRSYDRSRHNDPTRNDVASVLIDTIAGRRGQGISTEIRSGAHAVRRIRNYWAHEGDAASEPMTIAAARSRLQSYLSWLPEQWG